MAKKVATKMKLPVTRQLFDRHCFRPSMATDMANVSRRLNSHGNNRHEHGTMSNGTSDTLRDLGGSKSGTDSDGHEKEMVGMVQARKPKRRNRTLQSSC